MASKKDNSSGCLGAILNFLGLEKQKAEKVDQPLPYRVRDDYLSNAELSFYHVLKNAVAEKAVICPKSRLADIFFVSHPEKNRSYFNKISSKHIDFLLCEPKTMHPLMAIELNDASHNRSDRKDRDRFVKKVFQDAHLPLLFVSAQRTYNTQELELVIRHTLGLSGSQARHVESARISSTQALADQKADVAVAPTAVEKKVEVPAVPAVPAAPASPASKAPLCPKCGLPMVVRVASRGEHQGEKFYACPNFPKCRELRPYPPEK